MVSSTRLVACRAAVVSTATSGSIDMSTMVVEAIATKQLSVVRQISFRLSSSASALENVMTSTVPSESRVFASASVWLTAAVPVTC